MIDLDDVADDVGKPLVRFVISCLRFLLYLGWDWGVETIGWSVGWCFYRAISLGTFPKEKWEEQDNATLSTVLTVEFTGLGIIASLIYLLVKLV
jgi:hypothetical protein